MEPSEAKAEDLTEEERQMLQKAFEKLGAKPRVKTSQELKQWMEEMTNLSHEYEANQGQAGAYASNIKSENKSNMTPTLAPNYTPRISTFYGEPGKGDATYDLWCYEVETLRKSTFPLHIVDMQIRRSLRGEAAKVAMRLGPEATLDQLLLKLEGNYGLSFQHDKLMEQFYGAKQKPNEDVITWANRLEDLLYKACKQKLIQQDDRNDKLCSMFWSGLDPKLKEASGHLHYILKDFEKLKAAMKELEVDLKKDIKPQPAKMVVSTEEDSQAELRNIVNKLAIEVKEMREQQAVSTASMVQQHFNQNRYRPGNRGNRRPQRYYRNQGNRYQPQHQGNGYSQPQITRQESDSGRQENNTDDQYKNQNRGRDGSPVCWRCNQKGHLQIGCRVRMDNNRRAGLNSSRSALRGK